MEILESLLKNYPQLEPEFQAQIILKSDLSEKLADFENFLIDHADDNIDLSEICAIEEKLVDLNLTFNEYKKYHDIDDYLTSFPKISNLYYEHNLTFTLTSELYTCVESNLVVKQLDALEKLIEKYEFLLEWKIKSHTLHDEFSTIRQYARCNRH